MQLLVTLLQNEIIILRKEEERKKGRAPVAGMHENFKAKATGTHTEWLLSGPQEYDEALALTTSLQEE